MAKTGPSGKSTLAYDTYGRKITKEELQRRKLEKRKRLSATSEAERKRLYDEQVSRRRAWRASQAAEFSVKNEKIGARVKAKIAKKDNPPERKPSARAVAKAEAAYAERPYGRRPPNMSYKTKAQAATKPRSAGRTSAKYNKGRKAMG